MLAGELLAADGDHRVAFASYEEQFRGYAKATDKFATDIELKDYASGS